MSDYNIRQVREDDRAAVMDIFNYFVENSFAAFPETRVSDDFFDVLKTMVREQSFYVVESEERKVVGFSILRYYQRSLTFKEAAELTYFILPEHTRRGLGKRLLEKMAIDAAGMGVTILLAEISSRNETSLNFHRRNGFRECGRLAGVGRKQGQVFDVVWMQRPVSLPQ